MNKIDQITLDYLVRRTPYKKYVKNNVLEDEVITEQSKIYTTIDENKQTLLDKFQHLMKEPDENIKIQTLFEKFIEALLSEIKEEQIETNSFEPEQEQNENDDFDRNAEDEDDSLFEKIPEHVPNEIEYWKMQQVFKLSTSSSK